MLYVILMNFTEQGVRTVKDTVKRAKAFRAMAEKEFKTEVKDLFWTLGAYDVMALVDAPDEQTVTALALSLAAKGNVKTQTLRAIDEKEMSGILRKIK